MSGKRIVITGAGWITPLGHDLESVWKRLVNGETAVDTIRRFDASTFPTRFASQISDYDWKNYVEDANAHGNIGKHTAFALGASRQAWTMSGLGDMSDLDRRRVGLYLGAGEGVLNFDSYQKTSLTGWNPDKREVEGSRWVAGARQYIDGADEAAQEPNMPLCHIAREFGLRGPAFNCLTACAASTQAIGEAWSILRRG